MNGTVRGDDVITVNARGRLIVSLTFLLSHYKHVSMLLKRAPWAQPRLCSRTINRNKERPTVGLWRGIVLSQMLVH